MNDRIRILYVDDEPGLLEIGKIFLEENPDFQVDTLASAPKALAGSAIRSCEAIVSDYLMPEMDGIAFLKAVRDQFGNLPFILFTGKGREEVVIDAINNGADFYLQKGGDPRSQFAELTHKIRQAVGRRRAEFLRVKAEQDLRKNEERFRSLVEMIPVGVLVHDQNGKILYLNPEGLRLAGAKSVDDFSEMDVLASISPDDRAKVLEQNRLQHTENKVIPPVELRLLTLDGRSYSAEVTSKPILYGGIPAVLVSFQDLSPRKRTEDELRAAYEQIAASEEELRSNLDEIVHAQKEREKSERNFQTLVESAPDGIYTHHNGRFLYINRAALRLFGAACADQLVGTNVWDRIHPSFHGIVRQRVERLTVDQEPVGQYDEVYVRLDGSSFDVDVTAVPYLYEGQNGTLVMFRDITERKKKEGELFAKVEELASVRNNAAEARSGTR